jgi:hypothetical protein
MGEELQRGQQKLKECIAVFVHSGAIGKKASMINYKY